MKAGHEVASRDLDEVADDDQDDDFAQGGQATLDGDSASESEGEEAGGEDEGQPVDQEELNALKREAEEQQGVDGTQELGRGKRRRKEEPAQDNTESSQPAQTDEQAQAVWEAFQAQESQQASSSASKEMIKIVERYKFAGDEVVKERLLPADHPDAIAYLKRKGGTFPDVEEAGKNEIKESPKDTLSTTSPPVHLDLNTTTSSPTPAQSKPPPPGPRRKKQSKLASLAASSDQPKKMNTLEKSRLDWEGWKGAATTASRGSVQGGGAATGAGNNVLTDREREEMEQQTKTGSGTGSMAGYLGRSDFLERVKERTEGQ